MLEGQVGLAYGRFRLFRRLGLDLGFGLLLGLGRGSRFGRFFFLAVVALGFYFVRAPRRAAADAPAAAAAVVADEPAQPEPAAEKQTVAAPADEKKPEAAPAPKSKKKAKAKAEPKPAEQPEPAIGQPDLTLEQLRPALGEPLPPADKPVSLP